MEIFQSHVFGAHLICTLGERVAWPIKVDPSQVILRGPEGCFRLLDQWDSWLYVSIQGCSGTSRASKAVLSSETSRVTYSGPSYLLGL